MRAFAKVTRHGNSALIALPRPILFHLDVLYGDYVLLTGNDDGSVTIRKGEIVERPTAARSRMLEDRPAEAKS